MALAWSDSSADVLFGFSYVSVKHGDTQTRAQRHTDFVFQLVPGPPGGVAGPGPHERELDSDAIRLQSDGGRGEARRGSRDPDVLRRCGPHAGPSCRR